MGEPRMKKLLALVLSFMLCMLAATAFAEPSQSITIEVTFVSQEITVDDLGVGFLIPADFTVDLVSSDLATAGVVLSGTDAAGTYSLQVISEAQTTEMLMDTLDDNANVTSVEEVNINGIDLIGYALPSVSTFVIALPVGDEFMLSFIVVAQEGVTSLTMEQMQIVGSLFDL